jgi:hypothetical protein
MRRPSDLTKPVRRAAAALRRLRDRHEERHRPSGFGFALADRVDFLDGASWDALARDASVFMRRDVLRVIEQHGPENLSPRYALIFRGAAPVAALVAQVVSVSGDRLRRDPSVARANPSPNALRRALAPAARAASEPIRERMLVGGNLLCCGFHGVALAPGESPAEIWPGIAEALYRLRRAERLGGQTSVVMVKDLTGRQAGVEALRRFSYRALETDPDMVLAIDPAWTSYDDYLGALESKYRRNARDQEKKLAAAGCRTELLADPSEHAARLHALYREVHVNAPIRLVTLTESYFPALARALGEHFRCTVIRRGDEILGFVTSIRDGDTAIGYYLGFDRAAAAEGLPLYLRLLHATIGDAIAWRCSRLSLGRTALAPKAALGAKPEAMSVWLRHRVPALNLLVRGVLHAVPHDEPPERSPFKG